MLPGILSAKQARHRAVLASRERVPGPEHPAALGSRFKLARCLLAQQKNKEARQEAEAAYAGWKKVLGEGHPITVTAKELLNFIPSEK